MRYNKSMSSKNYKLNGRRALYAKKYMLELEKTEIHYRATLKASEYDYLEVISDGEGRIQIKFLDTRWRTTKETAKMLKEIVDLLTTTDFTTFTTPPLA